MAMIDFFDQGWSRNPRGAAYIMDERSYTFTEIGELSCRIANGLIAAGFGRGGKAAVLAANDPLAWTCTLGLWRAGMAWIPVNPRSSAEDNLYILDAFDCEVVFYQKLFAPMVDALRPRLPRVTLWVCIDEDRADAPSLAAWIKDQPATRPGRGQRDGRRGGADGHRRHHRHAQGRDEHAPQPADVRRQLHDRHPLQRGRPAGQPDGGTDDAHRRRAVDAVHGARRHRGHPGEAGPRGRCSARSRSTGSPSSSCRRR